LAVGAGRIARNALSILANAAKKALNPVARVGAGAGIVAREICRAIFVGRAALLVTRSLEANLIHGAARATIQIGFGATGRVVAARACEYEDRQNRNENTNDSLHDIPLFASPEGTHIC